MIDPNKISNPLDSNLVKLCPIGFVPVLVEKKQYYRTNGKPSLNWEFLYIPEYYNYVDMRNVCREFWEKRDPITNYKKSSARYQHRLCASYVSRTFHVASDGTIQWGDLMNDEHLKVARKYREGLTKEKIEWGIPLYEVSPIGDNLWNNPLDEELQYFSFIELQNKSESEKNTVEIRV